MNRKRILLPIFLLISYFIWGGEVILSVTDFPVESENPSYTHIGKGISRMVAIELRKSKSVKLIEREELNKILEEQEFSLSDISDQDNQIKIGKMLAADYLVLGEIIDMANTMLITVRLVDTTSGEIIWQDKLMEKLKTYDYIGSFFARLILEQFGAQAEESTLEKIAMKKEKSEEVIITLSKGIDAYDKKDMETAKAELKKASKNDPENEVAEYFLNKIVTNTARFMVIAEPYISYQNPAYLGIIEKDRLFFGASGGGDHLLNVITKGVDLYYKYAENVYLSEQPQRGRVGYYFPLFSNWGMGVEAFFSMNIDKFSPATGEDGSTSGREFKGGIVNAGVKLNNAFSLGLGISLFNESNTEWQHGDHLADVVDRAVFGFTCGFLYRNPNESLIVDSRLGYSNGTYDIIDPETIDFEKAAQLPIFWENSLTLAFNKKRTFLVTKQLNDFYLDTDSYFIRLLPLVEHYLFEWWTVRAGVEGSVTRLSSSTKLGYGVLGGLTFRILKAGIDIDFNFTHRKRPSRVVEGYMYPDYLFMLNFSKNGIALSRD